MCGIAGIVGFNPDSELAARMTGALFHRGPNDSGFYHNRLASVGVQRLSIVDIEGGRQPILNEDATAAVVFNGEIYNHGELRALLQSKGHLFRSASDSEVILHLYEEYGVDCLRHLRGMYAFAIVTSDEVFIARDRLGIKPLYYTILDGEQQLLFASEIKALLQHPRLQVTINPEALSDRRILRHFTREQSLFKEIRTLLPGHYFRIRLSSDALEVSMHQFHRGRIIPSRDVDLGEAMEGFGQVFQNATQRHLQGDVPVGLTLSGGIDSSLLAWFIGKGSAAIGPSFTMACSPGSGDSVAAGSLARHLGLAHVEFNPTFSEYCSMIPACVVAEEAVPSLYALPFLMLCRRMSGQLKVCLNGEGSDELFGGYDDYLHPSATARRLRNELSVAERTGLPVSARAREIVGLLSGATTFDECFRRMLETYQLEQLEYNHLLIVDRYSMAYSIEMRVPFMDDDVVDYVNQLPFHLKLNRELSISKYLLKHMVLRKCGPEMYDAVLRSKSGMPSAGFDYLMRFTKLCDESVSDGFVRSHPYKDFFCETDREGRIRGKAALLLFDLFSYFFIEHRGLPPASFSLRDFLEDKMIDGEGAWLQLRQEMPAREAYVTD